MDQIQTLDSEIHSHIRNEVSDKKVGGEGRDCRKSVSNCTREINHDN
jgi:hypothetical protein